MSSARAASVSSGSAASTSACAEHVSRIASAADRPSPSTAAFTPSAEAGVQRHQRAGLDDLGLAVAPLGTQPCGERVELLRRAGERVEGTPDLSAAPLLRHDGTGATGRGELSHGADADPRRRGDAAQRPRPGAGDATTPPGSRRSQSAHDQRGRRGAGVL